MLAWRPRCTPPGRLFPQLHTRDGQGVRGKQLQLSTGDGTSDAPTTIRPYAIVTWSRVYLLEVGTKEAPALLLAAQSLLQSLLDLLQLGHFGLQHVELALDDSSHKLQRVTIADRCDKRQ